MPSGYEPKDHIQRLEVAPRAEGILDQREITIQSYQTTVPFDRDALDAALESAWLAPQIRFGVFSRVPHVSRGAQSRPLIGALGVPPRSGANAIATSPPTPRSPEDEGLHGEETKAPRVVLPKRHFVAGIEAPGDIPDGTEALNVVLGLQDDLSVRAYDYDARRPLWYSWQNAIVDTVNIHYTSDDEGYLRFTAVGGGRRITDDRLYEFNSTFLGIPKDAVSKLHFDLAKLRELCFSRFIDRLYMIRFSHPSGEEYRSIDHALFQSRQYIDPETQRLQEVRADETGTIESFDSDVEVRSDDLASPIQVRFFIRGLSGSLRLRFPKTQFKTQIKTPEDQARVFYRIVGIAEKLILDADYYTKQRYSLEDLKTDLVLIPDLVDLTPFRKVMTSEAARKEFLSGINLAAPWQEWRPHLRALDELLPLEHIADHVAKLTGELVRRDPLMTSRLLAECQADSKINRMDTVVANVVANEIHAIPAEVRAQLEEALLSWAIEREQESWDVDPDSGEIMVLNLRWPKADLSLDVLTAVLGKLVGVLHARLVDSTGDTGALLRRFNWCMIAARDLPPNHSKLSPAFRLVAESRVPSSLAEGAKVIRGRVTDLHALDDAIMDQFGLPLWPCLTASRENGQVTLRNTGIGMARAMLATPSGTLFSDKEATAEIDLCPEQSVQLAVSGAPASLDVRFTKYGEERRIQVPITNAKRATSSALPGSQMQPETVSFDWAKQVELCRAVERVLGEGESPDRGTISKAVRAGQLESNGQSGRACRVKVDSFKAWITKAKELANDEVLQIMDAVMNEIRSRKR
jgi:hypothetical protein